MTPPENIYLTKNLLGELRDGWDALPSEEFTNIEYIRKDAFIKKACEWLSQTDFCHYYNKEFIDDFRKAMEE